MIETTTCAVEAGRLRKALLVELAVPGVDDAELVVIGIGHDHPTDIALADVDSGRAQRNESVDLRLLIRVLGWSNVEMEPVLPEFRVQRCANGYENIRSCLNHHWLPGPFENRLTQCISEHWYSYRWLNCYM